MSLRTIMIFPRFENIEIIDEIRKKYDPLAALVRPHITLVFPFEIEMTNEKLSRVLDNRLKNVKPFHIKLKGVSKEKDDFGNYLFLEVVEGMDKLCTIYNILYENEFKKLDLGLQYVPHMTIGKLPTVELLDDAYNHVKSMEDCFSTVVDKVSVEMIGDNEESIIVIEKKLK